MIGHHIQAQEEQIGNGSAKKKRWSRMGLIRMTSLKLRISDRTLGGTS